MRTALCRKQWCWCEEEEYYEFVTQNLIVSFNKLRPHVDFYRAEFSGSACARLGSFDKYGKNVQCAHVREQLKLQCTSSRQND